MRTLLVLLIALLCSHAAAQQRVVTFTLDDGLRIEGPVIEFDARRIVVEVGGEPRTYPTERMRECKFRIVEEDAASAGGEPAAPGMEAASGNKVRKPQPARRSVAVATDSARAHLSPWRQRTLELQESFPWLVPTESYQWMSLGVTLFALLALFSHFAAKLSGADQPGFGRAMGIALALMLALFLDFALIGRKDSAVGIALGMSLLLVPWLHRAGYKLSIPGTLLASTLFTLQIGLAYGAFRLIDTMLCSIGVGGA